MNNFFEPDNEHDFDDMRNVPQYAIERFCVQVEEVLRIFEMLEAFVSDETTVRDFNFTPQELESYNHKFKGKWGVEISVNDHIWEIAERIYETG